MSAEFGVLVINRPRFLSHLAIRLKEADVASATGVSRYEDDVVDGRVDVNLDVQLRREVEEREGAPRRHCVGKWTE
jgi:hypothetical protein